MGFCSRLQARSHSIVSQKCSLFNSVISDSWSTKWDSGVREVTSDLTLGFLCHKGGRHFTWIHCNVYCTANLLKITTDGTLWLSLASISAFWVIFSNSCYPTPSPTISHHHCVGESSPIHTMSCQLLFIPWSCFFIYFLKFIWHYSGCRWKNYVGTVIVLF